MDLGPSCLLFDGISVRHQTSHTGYLLLIYQFRLKLFYITWIFIELERLISFLCECLCFRFPYDVFDRIWLPVNNDNYFNRLSTSLTVDVNQTENQPPAIVMETTIVPKNASNPFSLTWETDDENTQYYAYLYFAELVELKRHQFRGFNISHNGKYWKGPVIPAYLNTSSIYNIKPLDPEKQHNLTFTRIENSTLPPIFNGSDQRLGRRSMHPKSISLEWYRLQQ